MRLLVWYGEVTSPGRLRARGLALMSLALLWLAVFLIAPSVLLVLVSFARRSAYGEVEWAFTFENFRRLAGFGVLGWSADYLRILVRSVWLAIVTTAACLALAYPLAFFIAARRPRTRYLWLGLVIIPFCTNLVVRTYGWMLLLSPQTPLSALARALGLIGDGQGLYPSLFAVYVGMVSSSLPFAVLPLYASVEHLDWSIVEAAQDLYGSRKRVFLHGILPQTMPGLMAAVILTFIPSMGAFVVPDLLGGAKVMLVGNLIQQQFNQSRDWPFGAAVSFGLMVLTLAGLFLLPRRAREGEAA